MKSVAFSKEALRALLRMPTATAKLIRAKIAQYASDPKSLKAQIDVLKGYDGVKRLRVGDWRILFSENGDVIAIIKIASRQSACDETGRIVE